MKFHAPLSLLGACVTTVQAYAVRAIPPTLYIAGDSTAAKDDGNVALLGWGEKIGQYLSIPIVNNAISGATTRSFTEGGNFTDIASAVKPGDIVIIEFGHNDNSTFSENPTTGDCPGDDLTTTCNYNGTTVYTYKRYLQDAVDLLQSRHARVIVASQTPDNPYAIFTIPVYVQYAADIAIANHLPYIDHFRLLLVTYYALGADKTNDLFPLDQHVHTSPEGADYVAQAVAKSALCDSTSPLKPFVTNTTVLPSYCVTG